MKKLFKKLGDAIKRTADGIVKFTVLVFELATTVAQASAAYILWFQGDLFMQAIATILAINAAITAVNKYTK